MAVEVILPKLGATMEEGTILSWRKREGDVTVQGEPLLEVETDKVVMEVESPASGVLRRVLADAGSVVPVGQVIGIISGVGEEISQIPALAPTAPADRPSLPAGGLGNEPIQSSATAEGVIASPAAKKLAREHAIDLHRLTGTGPGGRIVEKDVERAIATSRSSDRGTLSPSEATPGESFPVSPIRSKTAQRMAESFQTIPHFYLTVESRADTLVALRERLLRPVEVEVGVRLSFTDLFVRCVALALKKHPLANASWQEQHVRYNREINISIAMATQEGLLVPVIHNADTLTLAQVTQRRAALEVQAKERRLALDSVQGGTFTVTNLGAFGIDVFSPIINPPQAAILAIGRIAERAINRKGVLSLCPTVFLTLAADHRVLDGSQAAAFLGDLKGLIEREESCQSP